MNHPIKKPHFNPGDTIWVKWYSNPKAPIIYGFVVLSVRTGGLLGDIFYSVSKSDEAIPERYCHESFGKALISEGLAL